MDNKSKAIAMLIASLSGGLWLHFRTNSGAPHEVSRTAYIKKLIAEFNVSEGIVDFSVPVIKYETNGVEVRRGFDESDKKALEGLLVDIQSEHTGANIENIMDNSLLIHRGTPRIANGWVINEQGYFITCEHIFHGAVTDYIAEGLHGRKYEIEKVVLLSKELDLAIGKLTSPHPYKVGLPFSLVDTPGQRVEVRPYNFMTANSLVTGKTSERDNNFPYWSCIAVDCWERHSGSIVINLDDFSVIGIQVRQNKEEGIAYYVPFRTFRRLIENVLNPQSASLLSRTSEVLKYVPQSNYK